MAAGRDHLTEAEAVIVTTVETEVPAPGDPREIICNFNAMIRAKAIAGLDPWIEAMCDGLVASCAGGVTKDLNAVRADITEP